jgi:hypothetical protein
MNFKQHIFFVLWWLGSSWGYAQENAWVLAGQQPSSLEILQTDAQGYWYVAGNFTNYLKVGNLYIEQEKGRYFVMKYEPSTGKPVWVHQFAYPIKKMQIAPDTALYIAGQFRGTIGFGVVELTSYGEYSSYLAKINTQSSEFEWIRPIKAEKDALVGALSVDNVGNVCLTGNYLGVLRIGERTIRPIKYKNIYIAKFNPEGILLWLTQGTAGQDELTGISVWNTTIDSKNNIILTGTLCGTGFMGATPLKSGQENFAGEGKAFTTDIFLAKISSEGETIWAKSIANQAEVQSITTDTIGNVFLAGNFRGSESKKHNTGEAMFDDFKGLKISQKIDKKAIETCFVAKYSSLGNLIWVKGAESSGESRGTKIAWNAKQNCLYIAGFYYRDFKFGSFALTTPHEDSELFVATFAPNGAPKALQGTQDATDKILKDMHLTTFGDLFGVGLFKGSFQINKITLSTENPNICGFLVKLN